MAPTRPRESSRGTSANVSRVSRPHLNELFDDEVKARVTQALDAFDAFPGVAAVRFVASPINS